MEEKRTITPETQRKIKKIQKVERYSLNIGILCIFISIWLPIVNYISTAAFALTYVTALIKQKLQNGQIKFLSFFLCSASLIWVILRQFYDSPYVLLLGQIILYAYLLQSQKELLGQVKKSFAVYAVCAVALGVLRIYYPSKLTNGLNIVMQLWILYRFLDPILENIGQAHRRKRLAEEAERAKKEEEMRMQEEKKENLEKDSLGKAEPKLSSKNKVSKQRLLIKEEKTIFSQKNMEMEPA